MELMGQNATTLLPSSPCPVLSAKPGATTPQVQSSANQ